MAFTVEKRYLKTESYEWLQPPTGMSGTSICNVEVSETVQADWKCEHTERALFRPISLLHRDATLT